jgi:ABC-type transporter Mla MlaB component
MRSRSKAKGTAEVGRFAVDGSLTLRTIETTRAQLLEKMEQHPALEVDCSAASEIDLSFVQLLLSARASAQSAGKVLALAQPASGVLRDVLERGGFIGAVPGQVTADEAFWLKTARA